MKIKTQDVEAMLNYYKQFSTIATLLSTIISACVPVLLCYQKTEANVKTVWLITVAIVTLTVNRLMKAFNNILLSAYNDSVEHEAYIMQQSLKKNGLCDIDEGELDKAIKILQTVRDAKPPTDTPEEK